MTTEKKRSSRNATKSGIFASILLSGEAMGEEEEHYLAARRVRWIASFRKTLPTSLPCHR